MFSFDCRPNMMCEIFTTTKQDPKYKMMDGMVYESDDLKPLAIENIKEVVGYNTNFYDGNIRFFVTITTPTAAYGHRTMYTINTETGGVALNREECDWVDVNAGIFSGVYKAIPERSSLDTDINENLIIELYSK